MKRIRIFKYGILFVSVFVSVLFTACKKESSIGLELLPSGDLITIKSKAIKDDVSAYTFSENHIRTDERPHSLLGSIKDPVFGTTTVDMAAQFRLYNFPDFGENPEVDSVKLYLYYRVIYGDTLTYQKFKVYELSESIYPDVYDSTTSSSVVYPYYQDVDLKSMASIQLLGEREYRPRVLLDSTTLDTFYQLITIPIDVSLGEKLMAADSLQMSRTDLFVKYFKGLLIETEPVTDQGGTILSMESVPNTSVGFQGSALALFYSNDSIRNLANGDSSLVVPYIISPNSARVNSIVHDYSDTPFFGHLDSDAIEDSLIYVQATGGLKAKVTIDDLNSWADSVNTAINKAELIFQIDTAASQLKEFPPPAQLYLTYIDSTNAEQLPDDYFTSYLYYGGFLNTDDYSYHFNITQHLQDIIEGRIVNRGFYLTTGRKADQANRVVLKGSTSTKGIRLIITYSKFNI